MVQLQPTALTTKASDNNTLTRRNRPRNTNFSENAESAILCLEQEKILPVFVFPLELYFYLDDARSLTQRINIYNPYKWPIKFKFLVKTAHLWEVSEPGGTIQSDRFADVYVRPLHRSPSLIGKVDCLRVSMQTVSESLKLGIRDLPCKFLAGKRVEEEPIQTDPFSSNLDSFQDKLIETPPPTVKKPQDVAAPTAKSATSESDTQGANRKRSKNEKTFHLPVSAYFLGIFICILILCLPSSEKSVLPTYLIISQTPRYVAVYVLGIITSLLCKYC